MRLSVLSRRGSVHAGSPAAGSGGCSIILCAKTPAAVPAFVPARARPSLTSSRKWRMVSLPPSLCITSGWYCRGSMHDPLVTSARVDALLARAHAAELPSAHTAAADARQLQALAGSG